LLKAVAWMIKSL